MLVGHSPPFNWLSGKLKRWFQFSLDEGELALRLYRQGISIKLVSLPLIWLA
jgi:hypothetical protein